jgi:hypothetical protein
MFAKHQTTAGDFGRLLDLVAAISELLHSAMFVGAAVFCRRPIVRGKTVTQFWNNSGNSARASMVRQARQCGWRVKRNHPGRIQEKS